MPLIIYHISFLRWTWTEMNKIWRSGWRCVPWNHRVEIPFRKDVRPNKCVRCYCCGSDSILKTHRLGLHAEWVEFGSVSSPSVHGWCGGGVISLNSSGIHNKAAAIFFACVFALSRSTWCISPPTGDGSKYNKIGECDISVYIVISPCKNCSTNCILFWMEFSSTIFLLQPMHFMQPTTSRSFQTSVLRTL